MFSPERDAAKGNVQLRIWFGGMALDFRATHQAALPFRSEWQLKRWEAVELVTKPLCDVSLRPPLPCEQLFRNPLA